MALRARGCRAERRRWARATPRSPRDCEPARRDPPRDRLVWWTDSKSGGARLAHEAADAAGVTASALRRRARDRGDSGSERGAREDEHEWVGAETSFLGGVHGRDFYNRHPTTWGIVGTRRWAPGNRLEDVDAEFRALLASIAAETGCDIDLDLRLVRDTYRIDPAHPLVLALRNGYRDVTGAELGLVGMKVVADGAIFQHAGIPTVYHGPVGTGAHADVESITVAELVRATRVYLRTLAHLWA